MNSHPAWPCREMCHPTIYVSYKYINKLQFTQHTHEEGAVKFSQHLVSVSCMGEGLWLCPPEPWGNLFPFPPYPPQGRSVLGCGVPEQRVGQGHQAWGGQKLCQGMGRALTTPLLHLPPEHLQLG